MKKNYMQPKSACIDIVSEGMIASSDPIPVNPGGNTGDAASNHMGGWNSSNWTEYEE